MSTQPDNKRLMQKAVLELRDLKAKLAAVEAEKREPIAIIGMGCRFPGAENPTAFWQLLRDGVDAIGEIPADRWDVDAHYDPDPETPHKMYVRKGGYLQDVYHFDPAFFGIPPREVATMDPQQRLLLEVCWETLEDAGIVPGTLEQSETGVYIGYMNRDYIHQVEAAGSIHDTDPYMLTGNSFSFVAGRISYLLGLQGPSMVVATACSSSLVTVHLACQALRAGECDLALAGGVNLILHPIANVMLSNLRAISPDGRCKTFDAAADGYGRGEGCGMVALKRLSDALADGDRILGVVRGSATNHDGPSAGLTVPNGPAQEKLLHKALAAAEVTPDVVDYVEAHGTGTELGDPIEINSLVKVFGQRRAKPLWVGSVKTNVGHLEAAAGIVGLIKVLLAFQEEVIPPHLHFDNPNPLVAWDDIPVQVTDSLTPWPKGDQPRIAGVSSFGLSGINAHLIIEEAPVQASAIAEAALPSLERPLHLLPLSAKSEPALQALVQQYQAYFAANPDLSFSDVCYTAAARREHFSHRIAIVADSHTSASMALANVEASSTIAMPKVAFLFTGQGSQYINMGRELYQSQPTFRAALDRCDEILQPILGRSLLEIIYTADQSTNRPTDAGLLDQTAYTQPALFALEYALAELWQSWGVKPALVMGHSVGEYVAACVAGLFTLTDGLKLIAARGRLMQALPQAGSMVVIGASAADVVDAIAPYLDEVSIAAVNGPQNVVISGESVTVQLLAASFTDRGIKTTPLTVSHAFHSPLMAPMLADFRAVAEQVHYATPQTGFVSNVTGGLVHDEVASADYWCQHIRQPVRFAEGMATLAAQDVTAFVEVGPKPVLLGMGRPNLPDGNQLWLPTLRPEQEWRQLLTTLGALYTHGVAIDWQGVDRDYKRHRLALPTYPFQRKPYGVWDNDRKSVNGIQSALVNTDVGRWLTEGNTEQLAETIIQDGRFSAEQQALLPELLTTLLQRHQAQVASIVNQNGQGNYLDGDSQVEQADHQVGTNGVPPLWKQWQTTVDSERSSLLVAALEAQINRVLGYTQVDALALLRDVPLLTLGIDSLMGFELHKWVQDALRVELEVVDFLSGPSIAMLAEQLHEQLLQQHGEVTEIKQASVHQHGKNGHANVIQPAQTERYPLSYGQQALWFIHQSAADNVAYNVGLAFRIRSPLDVGALRDAFQAIVDRHPSLRTTFADTTSSARLDGTEDALLQIVHPTMAVDFVRYDSLFTPATSQQAVADAAAEPFDLVNGPLMRVRLFPISSEESNVQVVTQATTHSSDGNEHVLLISFHHIICDAWSTWTMLRELWTFYPSLKTDASLPPTLSTLPTVTYRDHVELETQRLAGPEGEQLWSYWQQQLADANPVLDLPTDHPRPAMQRYHGASHTSVVDGELARRLRELARTENATLYMTLLAAYYVLLHRYSEQEDILVGSSVAGRGQSEFTDVVGYFVNMMILRGKLDGNPTFRELLSRVRTTVLEAFAHQDYPYPLLVSRLQPERDPSRSPLIQVNFALQTLPPLAEQFKQAAQGNGPNALVLEPFELDGGEGQFDLTLQIIDDGDRLRAVFKYNTDLFEPATIARMDEHFQNLLAGIVDRPDQQIEELPLVTAAEEDQLLVEWNDTQAEPLAFPPRQCIHTLFEKQAALRPDVIAVMASGDHQTDAPSLTYRELNRRANQLAHHLQSLGIVPDARVGLYMERTTDLLVGLLGILKAGGAYVPLDPALPQQRLVAMLEDAEPSAIVTQSQFAAELPAQVQAAPIPQIYLDQDGDELAHYPETNPASAVAPENLVYVIFTSGSTGRPKGVSVTHANLSHYVAAITARLDLTAESTYATVTTFAADLGNTCIFPSLCLGGTLHLISHEYASDPMALANYFRAHSIDVLKIVPSHLAALLQSENATQFLPRQRLIVGGEAFGQALVDQLRLLAPQCRVFNHYGPSETTVGVITYQVSLDADVAESVPLGRPIAGTQVYILDTQLQPVPVGVPGELYIGGAGVARGYLNRPDLTAERFINSPFEEETRLYRTGDKARYLADGSIIYLGRLDQQVKIRGYRIELGEIEAILAQHPQVHEALVLAPKRQQSESRLVAYIIPVSFQTGPDTASLRNYLQARVPEYMIPSHFVLMDTFPLTANGKLDRAALPEPSVNQQEQNGYVPPRNAIELKLAAVWETILAIRPIGIHDNFFTLGGDSLSALRLMTGIQQEFGRALSLATLFQAGTVEQLATVLAQPEGNDQSVVRSAVVPMQTAGDGLPFFCVPGAGGDVIYLNKLAQTLGATRPFYGLQAVGLEGNERPHRTIEEMASHYLAAIRTVQPEGPYLLGGHSMGGWVAFEMAQQLQQQGEQVGLVALIDSRTPTPVDDDERRDWDDGRWIAELAYRIQHLLAPELDLSYETLCGLDAEEQLCLFHERLMQLDLFPTAGGLEQLRRLVAIYKAHSLVDYRIAQHLIPTPLALFRTEPSDEPSKASPALVELHRGIGQAVSQNSVTLPGLGEDVTWGWGAFGAVDLYRLLGDHLSILTEPHVQVLAGSLSAAMEKVICCQPQTFQVTNCIKLTS